jgi:hypothetical protein
MEMETLAELYVDELKGQGSWDVGIMPGCFSLPKPFTSRQRIPTSKDRTSS